MNILITGGGGFLGQHLARQAAQQGHQVTVYDVAFPRAIAELVQSRQVVQVQADITDAAALAQAVRTGDIEVIVHLATVLTDVCEQDPVRGTTINCGGAATVFETAIKLSVRRVIFGSSVAAFSAQASLPRGDDRPLAPANIYGATKVYTEHLASALREMHPATDLLGLRFGWVYGPGRVRGWNEIQRVIERFALERNPVPYPDFAGPNDWTYVEDAVRVILACLDSPRASVIAYNVSGDYRTIQEAVSHLQLRFPQVHATPYPAQLPPAAWDFKSDRLVSEVGVYPTTPLETGLDRTVDSIRASGNISA